MIVRLDQTEYRLLRDLLQGRMDTLRGKVEGQDERSALALLAERLDQVAFEDMAGQN